MRSKALAQNAPILWERNRGRNGFDVPSDVALDQSCQSINVELVANSLGRRRNGALIQTFSGAAFSRACILARFSPAQDNRNSELHFTTDDNKWIRVAGGTNAVALTNPDVSLNAAKASWTVLDGKLFWAYPSAVNRLHVYDPKSSTTAIRRTGLGPAFLAAINVGPSGPPFTTGLRYYRVRVQVRNVDGTLQREGEAGTAIPYTPPAGTVQSLILTLGTRPNEGETHWQVEGSADNLTFFVLAVLPIATTTYTDAALPTTYASNPAAPPAGTRSPFPSVKFLASDENRLLGFGVWPTTNVTDGGGAVPQRPGRVYFSPVLDSSDQDDDERIDYGADQPGYIDVGRNRGYEDRAIFGPLDGQFLVGQSLGIHMLVPTGEVTAPFRRVTLTDKLGVVSHQSSYIGEDETGKPCAYWLDETRGPYRYGRNGIEWLGYDMQDLWARINLEASIVAHGYFDTNLRACLWFVALDAGDTPNACFAFFVDAGRSQAEGVRGGWVELHSSRWISSAPSYSSVMFAETIAAPNSRRETGYVATSALWKINIRGAQDDGGTGFGASVESPAWEPPPKHVNKEAGVAYLQSSAHPTVTIRHTLTRNFGDRAQPKDAVVAAPGPGKRVLTAFKELAMTDAFALQVTLGDTGPVIAPAWTLDDYLITFESGDER